MFSGNIRMFFIVVFIYCSLADGKPLDNNEIVSESKDSSIALDVKSTISRKGTTSAKVGVQTTTMPMPGVSRVMQAPDTTRSTTGQPAMVTESEPEDQTLNWITYSVLSFFLVILIYSTIKFKFCPSNFARERDQAIMEELKKSAKKELVKEIRPEAKTNPVPPYAGTSIILMNTPESSDEPLFTEEFYSPYCQYNIQENSEDESSLCTDEAEEDLGCMKPKDEKSF